jgi:hypothetical protein
MCAAMLSVAWQTKLEVGRYLRNAKSSNALWLVESIERECHGAVSLKKLRRGLFLTICVCCSFYALFLYDTLGNAKGQHKAAWVFFVMALFPVVLYAAMRFQREYWKGTAQQLGFSVDDGMYELRLRESSMKSGSGSESSVSHSTSDLSVLGGAGGKTPVADVSDGAEDGTVSAIHSVGNGGIAVV